MERPYGGKTVTILIVIFLAILVAVEVYDAGHYSDAPDVVEVPIVLDLTGDRADEGMEYLRGIEIAIDDYNSIGGRRMVPVIYDAKSSAEGMAECFEDIKKKGYTFMLGPMDSEEACIVAFSDYDICALTFSVSSTVFSMYDDIFRNFTTDDQLANVMNTYLQGGCKSAAILYNDSFESTCTMTELMQKLDGQKTDVRSIKVDDPKDAADQLVGMSPEIVISLLPIASGLETIISESLEDGLRTKWLGVDSSVTQSVASLMDGFYAITTQRTITEPSFIDKYEKKYGESPDPKAMYGYDFTIILAEVVDSNGCSYDRFHDGMMAIRYIGMTGFIKFNEHGECYSTPNLVVSQNGEWKILSWKEILEL